MIGLDLIGAGENLSAYTIMLKIKSIDADKLRKAVTDKSWGGAIPGAIAMADSAPDLALGIVLPIAQGQLKNLGITADLSTTQKPPKAGSVRSTLTVLGVGLVLGFMLALAGRTLYHLVIPVRKTT